MNKPLETTKEPAEKPKLVIDEDWKSRVQAEKEAAARMQQESQAKQEPAGTQGDAAESGEPEHADHPLPPASFETHVSMLASQAMLALGVFPDPDSKKSVVRKQHAKHYIDTLAMLEDKTRGNLSADESGMLSRMLHELRMIYISVK